MKWKREITVIFLQDRWMSTKLMQHHVNKTGKLWLIQVKCSAKVPTYG